MTDLKYNYVIFGSCDEYYRVAYHELNQYDNVKVIMDYLDSHNPILKQIYRFHTSIKINQIIELPFKSIWNSRTFVDSFTDNKPICFVFFTRNPLCNPKFIDYLKKEYLNCKCVAFWQDLVKKTYVKDLDVMLTKKLDLALSFDHADAKNYGIIYYPSVYSNFEFPYSDKYNSDVYFLGKAKDRLHVILSAYEKFKDAGVNCDFNISGVPKKNRVYANDINYCNWIPYLENLKHIKGTKCLLEVMQGGGMGFTLRSAEAIMYDKKIITNNSMIKEAPFYNSELISTFTNPNDIDVTFPFQKSNKSYNCKESLYPSKMLEFIDQRI